MPERPTACMSFNYHLDHFGSTWQIRTKGAETAHTACVAFGLDRLTLALFAGHGPELARWPQSTREALNL
jgi:seryl-tRNA synthetase